jgi:hypothetical protein
LTKLNNNGCDTANIDHDSLKSYLKNIIPKINRFFSNFQESQCPKIITFNIKQIIGCINLNLQLILNIRRFIDVTKNDIVSLARVRINFFSRLSKIFVFLLLKNVKFLHLLFYVIRNGEDENLVQEVFEILYVLNSQQKFNLRK